MEPPLLQQMSTRLAVVHKRVKIQTLPKAIFCTAVSPDQVHTHIQADYTLHVGSHHYRSENGVQERVPHRLERLRTARPPCCVRWSSYAAVLAELARTSCSHSNDDFIHRLVLWPAHPGVVYISLYRIGIFRLNIRHVRWLGGLFQKSDKSEWSRRDPHQHIERTESQG